jgi:DHA2 family lincomycin resistance protein-like MFS transporter
MFFGFYIIYTFGQGLCIGNTMTYILSHLPRDLSADGNALINSLQQLSGAAGTAVAATMVAAAQQTTAAFDKGTAEGGQHVFIFMAILLFMALLAAVRMFKWKK